MPHFSSWAGPLPSIGSIPRAAAAIDKIEPTVPFAAKDRRVAWRGTAGWNRPHYPGQKAALLRVAGGKDWADVQASRGYGVGGGVGNASGRSGNTLLVDDFCRYRYVLFTERVTYSGRLQFLQMCAACVAAGVVAAYDASWSGRFGREIGREEGWEPDEGVGEAWTGRSKAAEANAVLVAPDWSDLERTVRWLEDNPGAAEGIARRQREVFVGKGYLSPPAEACYWRALIRGWSEVVR